MQATYVRSAQREAAYRLSSADNELLEDLSRRSFRYFLEQTSPETGLTLDRSRAAGAPYQPGIASIAATGFGLTALCIGAENGWMNSGEARRRVSLTLRFLFSSSHEHGWFYHFVNSDTGAREWKSEISSIDTALLLAGVLTARQYFQRDAEIVRLATQIYERVDFKWMLAGDSALLSHGWKPESGFIQHRWDNYSEHTLLYLLAIGSATHGISPASWYGWKRGWTTYADYRYLSSGAPLFTHQYSHAWVDYRGRRESRPPHTDYFQNSVVATRAHRAFCVDLAKEFSGYTGEVWGISASDSIRGYVAWGGPPRHPAIDGSVVPSAAGGSLMFTPDISLPALRAMHRIFGERIYGRYGFVDAFNPKTGWVDSDVIGISVGITLLSAENLRTGNVWRWFMANREVQQSMDRIGLNRYRARRQTG